MADGWRHRQRGTLPARPDLRTQGTTRVQDLHVHKHAVIIRGHAENSGRSDSALGPSGPVPSAQELRPHLLMIPPGTRCLPHFHSDAESALYVVSGEADVWHGTDLATRSAVRAGDFVYIPPCAPHLTVNRGEVTSIAVVARADPYDQAAPVVIELPRHLAGLLSYPVAVGE
jgi:uncharacterized RmlC-like cupin family protein